MCVCESVCVCVCTRERKRERAFPLPFAQIYASPYVLEWVTVCLCVRVPNTLNVPESVCVCVCVLEGIRTVMESRNPSGTERHGERRAGPGCEVVISAAQSERAESTRTSQANNSVSLSLSHTQSPRLCLGFFFVVFSFSSVPSRGGVKGETRERKNHKPLSNPRSLPDSAGRSRLCKTLWKLPVGPRKVWSSLFNQHVAQVGGRNRSRVWGCLTKTKKKRLNSVFFNHYPLISAGLKITQF